MNILTILPCQVRPGVSQHVSPDFIAGGTLSLNREINNSISKLAVKMRFVLFSGRILAPSMGTAVS